MQNRYKVLGIIFMVISILLIVGSIFFQQYLNIFSFLMLFYLVPVLILSIGVGLITIRDKFLIFKIILCSSVITLFYTGVYYLDIINFHQLIEVTDVEGINISNINMDLVSVINTFVTVVAISLLVRFFIKKARK